MQRAAVLFFAIVLSPAVARAEAGVAAPRCDEPSYVACADAAAGSACNGCSGAACACLKQQGCMPTDGGDFQLEAQKCANVSLCSDLGDLASCNGKNKGDPCGGDRSCEYGYCYTELDGGYVQDASTLACLAPLGGPGQDASGGSSASDAGSNTSSDSDSGGCSVAGATGGVPGFLFALFFFLLRRKR